MDRRQALIDDIDEAAVDFRRKSREVLCYHIRRLRKEGHTNAQIRDVIRGYYPVLSLNANTLIHWPIPVTMTRKEVNEAEAKVLAKSRHSGS